MKNLIIITGSILFICLFITSVILPSAANADAQNISDAPDISSSAPLETSKEKPSENSKAYESNTQNITFILKDYNNFISVFQSGKEKPIYISDTCVSDLPQADIDRLKKGIAVSDKKELKRLIEDYCS